MKKKKKNANTIVVTRKIQIEPIGESKTNDGLPATASYIIAKYEYYINGIRHTVKTQCFGSVPDTIILFYKKGSGDIRGEKEFSYPDKYKVLMGLWFIVGVSLLTIGISLMLGIDVIKNKFQRIKKFINST